SRRRRDAVLRDQRTGRSRRRDANPSGLRSGPSGARPALRDPRPRGARLRASTAREGPSRAQRSEHGWSHRVHPDGGAAREVGLVYFGKRYLNPFLGRWITPDPLALHEAGQGDPNLYAYVRGQSFKSVDLKGLQEYPGSVGSVADDSGNPATFTADNKVH